MDEGVKGSESLSSSEFHWSDIQVGSEQNDEGCDTTVDDSSTDVWNKNMIAYHNAILNSESG